MQDRMTDDFDKLVKELLSIRNTPQNQLLERASDPHNRKHDHNKFRSTNIQLQKIVKTLENTTVIEKNKKNRQ
jgi:hypothetical protein